MEQKLNMLYRRFMLMANVRRESSRNASNEGDDLNAIAFQNAAEAYERCADEVSRVMDGQTPPPPGERWD